MKRAQREQRRLWAYAVAGAVAAVACLYGLFRVPPAAPPRRIGGAAIGLMPIGARTFDPGKAEDSLLFDPTPLFLPTPISGSSIEKRLREPGGALADYRPKLIYGESALDLHLPAPSDAPTPAATLAGEPPGAPFMDFGRTDAPGPVVASRSAFVEVTEAATGRIVLTEALDGQPPIQGLWPPMEFLAAVDPAGLVGPLVRAPGGLIGDLGAAPAGVEEYFRNYLVKTERIGQKLGPGFYRISVGP
jgi:hypothetical protein